MPDQTEKDHIERCPKCGSRTPIGHRCIVDDLDAIRNADLSDHPLTQAIKNAAPQPESDDRLTVERLASEDPDLCPVDGLACRECPSYCLEVYEAEQVRSSPAAPATHGGEDIGDELMRRALSTWGQDGAS